MDNFSPDILFMRMALREAEAAAAEGEVPCGAVIVRDGEVLGKAHNQTETLNDPTAHAEILAITQAAQAVGNWRLNGAVMYVTKEPCPMCAGALVLARIQKVVWGMTDPVRGGAISKFQILNTADLNHAVEIETGLMEDDCKAVMQDFFQNIRQASKDRKRHARQDDTGVAPPHDKFDR
ncbi:tRNA adenosine(34) deaminase TadA [Pontiella sulfatireligans]|uniref:tRNA-specific adenosine deaminase n=1 Tax=Pontiella sulfatireligans TaxID=2750658 RepID=A0A6C2UN00_9BACT|nr:tRNA adenosine(34) deaminase TadA [Pontiella sulfatireligans]VGO20651.1 tRNA-specific adenosine deaminase [Pontiella sulfatireligans]